MKTIFLYGDLATKYGHEMQLDVQSVAEFINAMAVNYPNFIEDIKGSNYQITNIHDGKENTMTEQELSLSFPNGDFHITPSIDGNIAWWVMVIIFIAAFAATMILFTPEMPEEEDFGKSSDFGGGDNTVKQGGPIPLVYGKVMCGSTVVSASLTNEDTGNSKGLTSNATMKVIDVISEGEIEGFANADYEKSIYLNETQYKDNYGYNFKGVSTIIKYGTPDQTYLPAYSSATTVSFNTKLVFETPIVKTITNTDVDECQITVHVPSLYHMSSKGKTREKKVEFSVWINGTHYKIFSIYGRCKSSYYKTYQLPPLSNYGAGPWEIKLDRTQDESTSTSNADSIYWLDYVELINEKLPYYNTALIGFTADAAQFGQKLPKRLYEVKGIKIKYPSNYDTVTRTYTGVWDGTFLVGYTNNPAWVYYDILNNSRYGCNLDAINKWDLYTCAQICDVMVDDGKGGVEPRFTINMVINKRVDAMKLLATIASVFRALPLWYDGQVTVVQDKYRLPTQVITNANVKDGLFNYSGTALENKITEISVTWNDPDDLYRKAVEVIADEDGIERYGLKKKSITAYGCTSRAQAQRYGKWHLYTEINQGEMVEYTCSFDQVNVTPGEVVIINDSHYITKRLGGKVKSATTTQIVIDAEIELEVGKTYTIRLINAAGELVTTDITTSASTTDTLDITTIASGDVPQAWSNFSINSSSFDERLFKIVSMNMKEEEIKVKAVLHDNNKYDAIDQCITFDEKHYTNIETGPLDPPTDLSAEGYTYVDGENDLFGVLFSWTHSDDTRLVNYEVQTTTESGMYEHEATTEQTSYAYEPVTSGTLYWRIRANGVSDKSAWVSSSGEILTDPDPLPDITGLQVLGGGSTFNGRNIEIEWDANDMTLGRFQCYTIKIYSTSGTPVTNNLLDSTLDNILDSVGGIITTAGDGSGVVEGDVLLREVNVTENNYTYIFDHNEEDNGIASRSIKFIAYVKDVYDKLSEVGAVLVASNPIPDYTGMSPNISATFKGVLVDWSNIVGNDNDLDKFDIFVDTNDPPTTKVGTVGAETLIFLVAELDTDLLYYVQVLPHDVFGSGVKSSVVSETPLKLGIVDVEAELNGSIIMSDSDGNTQEDLATLYDRSTDSGGIIYIVT